MSFLDIAKKRQSVRSFENRPVEKEKLLQVLEAARVAPSAVNYQPWHFIVLQDEEMKKKVANSYAKDWLQKAPIIIVACGDHSKSWHRADGKDHLDIDLAIAVEHMVLAAVDLGLGSCWVCAFDAKKCSKVLDLPAEFEPIALLPLGYPAGEPADPNRHASRRKPLDDFIHWDGLNK
ncbi:nitroreductase family protein [Bacillota bacterium LX-D]|nr:nitroreductase family protein [Bacillota bacterium LX-D]